MSCATQMMPSCFRPAETYCDTYRISGPKKTEHHYSLLVRGCQVFPRRKKKRVERRDIIKSLGFKMLLFVKNKRYRLTEAIFVRQKNTTNDNHKFACSLKLPRQFSEKRRFKAAIVVSIPDSVESQPHRHAIIGPWSVPVKP